MSADFREQPHARARGRVGEDDAVAWLTVHGYEILQRNLVNHGGEIDVVARDGATLCFLEIKARDGDRFGPAIAAVNFTKQRRLSRAASLYVATRGPPQPALPLRRPGPRPRGRRLALHPDQERLPLQSWTRPAAPVGAKRAGTDRAPVGERPPREGEGLPPVGRERPQEGRVFPNSPQRPPHWGRAFPFSGEAAPNPGRLFPFSGRAFPPLGARPPPAHPGPFPAFRLDSPHPPDYPLRACWAGIAQW